jgi:hypothetical protein
MTQHKTEAPATWQFLMMPEEPTWWVWLVTAALLAFGLAGRPSAFAAAIVLSIAQSLVFVLRGRSLMSFPVQIRVAYTMLLLVCYIPGMRWLYVLPTAGTFALVLVGYCLMARVLSLLPWNRSAPFTLDLVRRTFLSPPVVGNVTQGMPRAACPGGVCSLEAQVAQRHPATERE